ncbi:MAG: hypothetical protein M1832_005869 [Thelocarpon impressellum]|nr:MAG: hypothetical protein M1832_005869 [Thelocarpon impressellum]
MAPDPSSGYVAVSGLQDLRDDSLPVFNVERVQLQFPISSDFVAAQVANNVLILALSTGRILRIDLDNPADIDDIDLPKRSSETGVIRRMFLDPTSSHLLITTALGENYYLHTQSRQPKALSRLKGVAIESIAWNPSLPTASTREILVGAADGNVYEVYIEPSTEFYRREEKYLKSVYKLSDGPVTGLWADLIPGKPELRRVLVASQERLLHFVGRIGRHGSEGGGSIFTKLFETESPTSHTITRLPGSTASALVVSPDTPDGTAFDNASSDRTFGWLSSQGLFCGTLLTSSASEELGKAVFSESKLFPRSQIPDPDNTAGRRRSAPQAGGAVSTVALTQWHLLHLVDGRIVAMDRLDQRIVYDQLVLEPGQKALGLFADQKKNTFWLFTGQEIFEIVVTDEDRDVWRIMLKRDRFDAALRHAKTPAQRDAVATASGDHLVRKGLYLDAAGVYGKSSKPFEQVSLNFIDHGEQDALRKYLLTKLATFKKSSSMQRTMIASWLLEIFMAKLNSLDDTITTKAELSESTTGESQQMLSVIRTEFQDFATRYKPDLDRKTTYDVISSHGREEELLFYATLVNDHNYVLGYWVQRERWPEALAVLKRQSDPKIFYAYSSVLMSHAAVELVDILTRQSNLDARSLIPALLNYNKEARVPLSQNQAVRYLLFVIGQLRSTDAAVHNTLISIYASHPSRDESALLSYLKSQSHQQEQSYDADFALRLCIQHKRVQSCVHIYGSMGQYPQAVDLALKNDEVELASMVADRPEENPALRKKLWLAVAKKVISQSDGIKTAIEFLKRCELLKIEDLIPFFPDFVIIDDFKEEICAALEEYSRHIDSLKKEMDESARTAASIKTKIAALDNRYALVEPGERCYSCQYPLLSRQFFVFPCQHAFHGDCLGRRVVEQAGVGKGRRIKELQTEVSRGVSGGPRRERAVRELDALVAAACILCSEGAVKLIDEPFVTAADDKAAWAL